MVILLDGTSQMARVTLAERAIADHPTWRHLALEVLEEAAAPAEGKDAHLQIIKRCADELDQSGLHLILTMPAESPHRRMLAATLAPNCTTVHLGTDDDGTYDFVIDPSTSVNEVIALLHAVMSPQSDA